MITTIASYHLGLADWRAIRPEHTQAASKKNVMASCKTPATRKPQCLTFYSNQTLTEIDMRFCWSHTCRLTNQRELKSKECQPPHKTSLTFETRSLTRHERCQNHALRSRPFSLVVLKQTHVKLVRLHSKRKLHKLSESQLQFNRRSLFSKNTQNKTDHKVTTP